MSRSLSKRESEVVLELEWSGRRCVTIKDVSSLLNCSYDYAKKIAQRLVEKRWFEPIGKGRYLLIGASSGKEGIPNANALLTGSFLVNPYYFSYSTSNAFYGFSTQMPSTVYIATTKNKHSVKIGNSHYRFIVISGRKFFGFENVRIFDADVLMADKEKTIVDSVDKIRYAGGIREVFDVLKNGLKKVDVTRLMDYAVRMGSNSLIQRLGFLLEDTGIEFNEETLLKHMSRSTAFLDPHGEKKGKFHKKWRIICNISEDLHD